MIQRERLRRRDGAVSHLWKSIHVLASALRRGSPAAKADSEQERTGDITDGWLAGTRLVATFPLGFERVVGR